MKVAFVSMCAPVMDRPTVQSVPPPCPVLLEFYLGEPGKDQSDHIILHSRPSERIIRV